MDPNRFDHLTKSLAAGLSRRRVLGSMLGALGSAVGLGRTSAAGCRRFGQSCSPTAACCAGTVCVNGTCQFPSAGGGGCLPGFTNCNGHCTLLTTDVNNCGACGNVCPADMPICGGHCMCSSTSCPAGQGCCGAGGSCIDVTANNNNCGACGNACSGTTTCSGGTCVQQCTLDPTICASTEVCDASQGCVPGTCATYTLDPSTQCHDDTTNNGCAMASLLSTGDEAPTINGYPTCSWSCPDPADYWAVCDSSGCICQHFD